MECYRQPRIEGQVAALHVAVERENGLARVGVRCRRVACCPRVRWDADLHFRRVVGSEARLD